MYSGYRIKLIVLIFIVFSFPVCAIGKPGVPFGDILPGFRMQPTIISLFSRFREIVILKQ